MERLQDLKDVFTQPKVYRPLVAIAAAAVAALYFTSYVVTAALVVGTAVTAFMMNKLNMKQVGVELATLSTILIAVTYGPVVGAVVGLAVITLQVTAGQYTGSYIIWVIPSYGIAGFIAGSLSGADIFTLGFGLTAGMQVVFAALTSVMASGNLSRYLPYAVTNVLFNFAVFMYVAPALLPLMS
ncbi:MAG: hypothetical protein ABEJ64_02955 [Candidatus Nanohaloarchaea archaeon]